MEIQMKYKTELEKTKTKQDSWYKILVKLADSYGLGLMENPLVICDEMRLAARSLNLNDKSWLKDFVLYEKVPCKACGALKNPDYPFCQMCKAVDLSHPAAAGLKFSA